MTRFHQVELAGARLHPSLSLLPGGLVEQIELGTCDTGVTGVTMMAQWSWEDGWTIGMSWRRSGSDQWRHTKVEGVPEECVPEQMQEMSATILGLT